MISKLNNIFIGFDQKEAIAYHTFVQSLIERSSIPLEYRGFGHVKLKSIKESEEKINHLMIKIINKESKTNYKVA